MSSTQLAEPRLSSEKTEVDEKASDINSKLTADEIKELNAEANKETAKKEEDAEAVNSDGEDESKYPTGLKLTLIIASLMMSVFLVALDQTIIAPALGAITADYGSTKDIGWYGSSYLLTTTALQPMYGTLYKYFNVKIFFMVGIFIFEVGSLLTAVAPTSVAFIIGRAVAGIGTAGLFSGAIVILSLTVPLRKRPVFFGFIGAIWGVASVAGPLLGGAFTQGITWRWCFYINLPIGGLAAFIVFLFVNVGRNTEEGVGMTVWERIKDLDLLGTGVFIPAIVCLILALQWGGTDYPWKSGHVIGLFCGAGGLLIIFIAIQIWKGDKGTLPPRLFKNKDVAFAAVFVFMFGAAFFCQIYYISLYFQAVQEDSAVHAGIKLLPLLLSFVLMSVVSGGLISAIGTYNYVTIPLIALYAIGSGLLTTWDAHSPEREWFGYQVVCGLGGGPGFQLGVLVVQTVLPQEWVPVGSAGVQFFTTLGGAIAVAICQSLFTTGIINGINKADIGIDPQVFINSGANQIRAVLTKMDRLDAYDDVVGAYMTGLRDTYYLGAACAALATVACASLSWKSVKKGPNGAQPAMAG